MVGGARAKEVKRKSLRGRRSTREDKKDQVDKPLHWVNMQILDHRYVCMLLLPPSHHHTCTLNTHTHTHTHTHRALLHQGVQRLNMWPILPDSNGATSKMAPMGSTAINPDGNHSAVLYIELDSYAHSVACPTGGWGENAPA